MRNRFKFSKLLVHLGLLGWAIANIGTDLKFTKPNAKRFCSRSPSQLPLGLLLRCADPGSTGPGQGHGAADMTQHVANDPTVDPKCYKITVDHS